ncbi:hypothetical protein Y032_0053g2355 [Ancylostoma ceylanicum]|uniref:Uncharacterized protein n=1 Tax=Ancylostoma ceylanicum TaxID=53326 RepID=A0A016U6D3_9BILA|nr:hypothetical protein Y032_0053g2355 [Ancylostoma ceylanicum]
MHELPRWGGEGISEAVKYWSHFKCCKHDCPHMESPVDPLHMSEVLNHVRRIRMGARLVRYDNKGCAAGPLRY